VKDIAHIPKLWNES